MIVTIPALDADSVCALMAREGSMRFRRGRKTPELDAAVGGPTVSTKVNPTGVPRQFTEYTTEAMRMPENGDCNYDAKANPATVAAEIARADGAELDESAVKADEEYCDEEIVFLVYLGPHSEAENRHLGRVVRGGKYEVASELAETLLRDAPASWERASSADGHDAASD